MSEPLLRLLLLDDEASLREPLAKRLRERHRYVVDAVPNGYEALRLLQDKKGQYDVALIDEVLDTGPDGLEVLKQMKVSYPQIEVILFSGWGLDNALAAIQAGAFRYLAKPFHEDELAVLIRHAAEYRSLKGAVREKQILEQLLETSTVLLSDRGEQDVLTRILEGIHAVGFDRVRLYLLSQDRQFMQGKAHVGMNTDFIGIRWPLSDDHHMQILINHPRPYIFKREENKALPFESKLSKEDVNEWACLPLMLEGRVIGKLSADKKFSQHPITEEELHPLTIFASQAAVAIENVRMFEETSRRANELEILRQTALAITSPLDRETTLETVLQQALLLLNARSGGIDEYDFKNDRITVIAEYGRSKSSVGNVLHVGEGIVGRLIAGPEPFIILENYSEWQDKVESYEDRQYGAVVAVPLLWQENRIGVIYVDDEIGRIFTAEDAKLLSMFADQAAIVLVNSNTIHELSTTKDYLDRLIASSIDGIVTIDTQGRVTGFNAMAEQILGYEAKEVLGQPVHNLYYNPDEPNRIGEFLRRASDSKLIDYYTDVKSNRGDKIPIRLSATWLFDAQGKRIGSAGYFRDLRHIQEVEMQRQRLLEASNAMSQAETLEEGLQNLSRIAVESCVATFCSIQLADTENQELIVKAAYPYPRSEPLNWEPKLEKVCQAFRQSESAELLSGQKPVILQRGQSLDHQILDHLSEELKLNAPLASALLIPLEVNKKRLGVCILGEVRHWTRSPITESKVELATSLMAQGAVLIEKMRLHALTQRRAEILAAMQDLALTVSSSLDLDTILRKACQAAVDLFDVDHSGLVLFDPNFVQGKVAAEYPGSMQAKGTDIPLKGVPFEEKILNERTPVIILDVENESQLGSVREIMHGRFNIHSAVFVPVISNERVLGSFSLDSVGHKRQFTSEEIGLCKLFAAHVASAIENARLHEETAQHNRLLKALDVASRLIRAENEPDKLLHKVVQISTDLMHCTSSGLFINYPLMRELELVAAFGLSETPLKSRLSHISGLVGQVARTGEAKVVYDYATWHDAETIFDVYNFKTVVAIPLKHVGEVEAVLFVADQSGSWRCGPKDVNILERFAAQASIALHASQLIGKEQRGFSQLSTLHRISDYLQQARDLDKILHVVLTAVTAGYGLGFNRAAILLVDETRKNLEGGMGIGFLNEADAWKDWESHHERGLEDFGKYLEALEKNNLDLTPIGKNIRSLRLPILADDSNALSQSIANQSWLRISQEDLINLPPSFGKAFEPALPGVLVPLIAREQVIGLLIADNKFNRSPITSEDINSLMIFANTAAVAIDNVRLFQAVEQAHKKIRSTFVAGNALASSQDPEQILQAIAEQAHVAASASWVTLFLIDELGQVEDFITTGPKPSSDPGNLIRENGYSIHVMRTGQPFIISDVQEPNFQVNPRMIENGVKAALCMPLTLLGKQIGVIWIHYNQPRFFHDYEIEAIQLYVNQATVAYDNARQMKQLEHMRQVAQLLASADSLNDVLEQILQGARDVLRGDSIAIWSYDDQRRKFILAKSVNTNIPEDIWDGLQRIELDPGGTVFTIMKQGWIGVTDINDQLKEPSRKLLAQMGVQSFQGIALNIGEEQLGVLFVNYNHRRKLNIKDRETAITFANHAAIALKKAKLLEQLGNAKKASEVVAEVMALENKAITLTSVVERIRSVVDCDAVAVFDYNESTNKLNHPPTMVGVHSPEKAKRFSEVEPNSLVYHMLAQSGPYIVSENETDPYFGVSRFTKEEGIKSCVAIPLVAAQKKVGVLFVNYRSYHRFTDDELADVKLFAHQAAVAIHNAQLYEQEHKRVNALQALHHAGQVITRSLELEEILNLIAEQAWFLVGENDGLIGLSEIWLVQESHRAAVVAAYPPELEPARPKAREPRTLDLKRRAADIVVRTLQSKKAQLINGVNSDYNDQLSRSGMHSLIAVPICLNQRVIGVIKLGHPDSNAFDEKDQMALEALAAQAAIAIQNAQRFEDLKRIKGFIGSKTAVDWIQMVSTVWGHSIRREVGTALGHIKLLDGLLQDSNAPGEAKVELNYLEDIVRNIGSIPITAPLSSEDAVRSIKINELLDTYLRRQWQHSQYKPINLELVLQEDLDNNITVRASKEWLWHFFKILVDNSVQAMLKTDRPSKRLIVTTQLVEKTVEILIQDTGPGIPNHIAKKIFEEPIDKPVGSRGAGIGLVLARTIIETYEGSVRLLSTNKHGTSMRVTLPVENRELQPAVND